jgi:uncharacterized OsmC-like protein
MSDLKFRVKAHSENPTLTKVKARGFEIVIDEPEQLGGTNQGANPVEYELAAFSGCINVMGHVIAKEMNMDLKGIEIDISGLLNPNKLFGKSMEERAGYKQIDVKIKPSSTADKETLEKWRDAICERCPVSDNLKNTTPVNVEVLN